MSNAQAAGIDGTNGMARPGPPGVSVCLYIDADNQSPHCARALLDLLRADFDARLLSATIAGNNNGQQIDSWANELVSAIPELVVRPLNVPHRKQGADVALLMTLGADLDRHIKNGVLVVIVSRDDLVIGAAEQAKAYGCRTLVAYADGDIATARSPRLTTLLLPAFTKPIVVAPAPSVLIQAANPGTSVHQTDRHRGDEVAAVLAKVRGLIKQKPGGGYSATDVGQALSKLGHDRAARERILISVPKRGAGATLTYVF